MLFSFIGVWAGGIAQVASVWVPLARRVEAPTRRAAMRAVLPGAEPEATPATAAKRRSRVRNLLVLAVALGFIALLALGLLKQAPNESIDQTLAEGRAAAAPGFELAVLEEGDLPASVAREVTPALADGEVALSELRGTPVVLNFWASWCIPCREEAPLLAQSWDRYGQRDVLFVGLNMQDATDNAREFIREFANDYLNVR